jgi:hypothetical protein
MVAHAIIDELAAAFRPNHPERWRLARAASGSM